MNDEWVDFFRKLAIEHSNPVSQSGWMVDNVAIEELAFDKWAATMQSYLQVSSNDYLLEVGCGSGLILKRFAAFTRNLYGVDPSEESLRSACKSCPVAQFRVGHALDASFGELRFSRLICNSVFLYFEDLAYARKVIDYFLSITTTSAKIFIGDLPTPTSEMTDGYYRRKTKTPGFMVQHYPVSYMHDICRVLGVRSQFINQEIPEKVSSAFRYDFLIEKVDKQRR